MTEIPQGFSFEETDDGYILRRNLAGEITELRMKPEEFDALKTAIDLWKDRRLSGYQVAGGEVLPIVVHPVSEAVLWPDAMNAHVLLNAVAPSGGHITLSFPPSVASLMAEALPEVLAKIANPTKQ
jgi:hypothetical protein